MVPQFWIALFFQQFLLAAEVILCVRDKAVQRLSDQLFSGAVTHGLMQLVDQVDQLPVLPVHLIHFDT